MGDDFGFALDAEEDSNGELDGDDTGLEMELDFFHLSTDGMFCHDCDGTTSACWPRMAGINFSLDYMVR